MGQFEFEAILKIIGSGAPALAEQLGNAFIKLVESERTLALRVEELEKQVRSYQCVKPEIKEEE